MTKGKADRAGSRDCRTCSNWREIKQKLRVTELLETAIKQLETRFTDKDFRPTVGDYLKLVQMEQELEESSREAKEIKVTWVEPETSGTEK